MSFDTELNLLAKQAVELQARINALGLPQEDRARRLLLYELTKVRVRIRDVKRLRDGMKQPRARRLSGRRLIPYAGAGG